MVGWCEGGSEFYYRDTRWRHTTNVALGPMLSLLLVNILSTSPGEEQGEGDFVDDVAAVEFSTDETICVCVFVYVAESEANNGNGTCETNKCQRHRFLAIETLNVLVGL